MIEEAVKIKYRKLHPDAKMFQRQTEGSAGMDMYAFSNTIIPPYQIALIPTGIAVELPEWLEGQVRCRSGLAKKGIMIANGVGTVDSDYRGDVGVLLYNSTKYEFPVFKGDRIAQFLIAPVLQIAMEEVTELSDTARGDGGYGSTGK